MKNIQVKLDTDLANTEWVAMFTFANVMYGNYLGSNHRPLLINLNLVRTKRKKRFMYEEKWE